MDISVPIGMPTHILGVPVSRVERAAWGFEHATFIVDLADARRVVVQQIRRPGLAARRLANALAVPAVLRAAGLLAPWWRGPAAGGALAEARRCLPSILPCPALATSSIEF